MRFDIFTLFPECFSGPLQSSILKRAIERGLVSVHLHNIRDYATDRHHVCDDYPYGGGGGMVMKPEPIFAAVESVLGVEVVLAAESVPGEESVKDPETGTGDPTPVILLTPQGRVFKDTVARELARHQRIVLVCGHYEGVDERVREHLCTDEISIGDYVLTGGELPALVVIDAVTRLLPGVLGDQTSAATESHAGGLLEGPQYTRPANFRGWKVPEILLSGHHAEVDNWRREQARQRTVERRPDLLDKLE